MGVQLIVLTIIALVSTLVGGLFALRHKSSLCGFFAFSAGSLIAVSFLDLLPESVDLANRVGLSVRYIGLMIIGAFLFYTFLEKVFMTHHHHDDEGHGHIMGPIGAGSLVLHSFIDGIAIGAAFQVNASIGLIVALAVISHDFTDGINTVTLMLKNKHRSRNALLFLIADALAPVFGVIFASVILIGDKALALLLAFFVGEFIYLGASNLLPELREEKSLKILLWMLLGAVVIYVLTLIV
jgi:ZIP family zinc transporter